MIGLLQNNPMLSNDQIKKRKPIWEAFSDLWLDNELQDYDIKRIADSMKESQYSIHELEEIFSREVAPAVYKNTFSMTGEWAGFETEVLTKAILENLKKQESNFIYRVWVNSSAGKYLMTKMVEDDWKKIVLQFKNNQ